MPYNKSRARQEFETTSKKLDSLAREISYKKVTLSYDHKNLIYQSTIVLLCSSLEEYLRVFVEDLFFSYKSNSAILSDIPSNLRTYSLFLKQKAIFENFTNNRDEVKILEKMNIENEHLYSVINDNDVLNNQIKAKEIVNDKKYPSPKNIKILFNRFGIKDLFVETNKIGKKDYEFLLRSFLDIRETIAHQESTDLTYIDVKRNFKNINDLIDKLDRISFKYICNVSGLKYWK